MGEGILMGYIAAPIFIVEDEDILTFASVRDAQLDLEPIDVKLGDFVAYDSEGRLLRVQTNGRSVTISSAENEPTHPAQLETALRRFLKALNAPQAEDPMCDLSCLVNACRNLA
jgi:hypothetical protein